MSRWELRLPWSAVPLSANGREHWRARAAKVAEVRSAVHRIASDHDRRLWNVDLPYHVDHVTVGLHYWPRDRRRRDADNLMPTMKAACDGLVDARVVADDTPDLMTKVMPVIHEPDGDPRLVLVITTEGDQ